MGTAAGVTNFCGLHANVHGEIKQVVHGVADDLLERMRELGGLNEPHVIFGGKIAAQAYDNAVLKVAADTLVLSSGVRLLFHAQAVGVMMASPSQISAVLIETKQATLPCWAAPLSTARAMVTWPPWPVRRLKKVARWMPMGTAQA
jgi:FAD dependent oxidoreductase